MRTDPDRCCGDLGRVPEACGGSNPYGCAILGTYSTPSYSQIALAGRKLSGRACSCVLLREAQGTAVGALSRFRGSRNHRGLTLRKPRGPVLGLRNNDRDRSASHRERIFLKLSKFGFYSISADFFYENGRVHAGIGWRRPGQDMTSAPGATTGSLTVRMLIARCFLIECHTATQNKMKVISKWLGT